jgi:protein TonB
MSSTVLRWESERTPRPLMVAVVLVHGVLLWLALTLWGPPEFKAAQAPVLALLLPEPPAKAPPPPQAPAVASRRPVPDTPPAATVAPPEPVAPAPPASVLATPAPSASPMVVAPVAPAPTSAAAVASSTPTPPAVVAPPVRTPAMLQASQTCEKPLYPAASRRLEEEGTVLLRFLVQADGRVVDSQIEKTSGFRRLDEAARQALARCQFKPATVDGKPEQSWASIRYTWRLE